MSWWVREGEKGSKANGPSEWEWEKGRGRDEESIGCTTQKWWPHVLIHAKRQAKRRPRERERERESGHHRWKLVPPKSAEKNTLNWVKEGGQVNDQMKKGKWSITDDTDTGLVHICNEGKNVNLYSIYFEEQKGERGEWKREREERQKRRRRCQSQSRNMLLALGVTA